MANWLLTLTDGTEYELTDQEYRFLQDKINDGKKIVFYQTKAINTAYIRHIKQLQTAIASANLEIHAPKRYSVDNLKDMYQTYLWNLEDFEKMMKGGKIHGFLTERSRNHYLKNHFNPNPVTFDDFCTRYDLDCSRGDEFLHMQRWFWR